MSQCAIVRQKKKSFRVIVETTDCKDSGFGWNDVENRAAPLRIMRCGDDSSWFVQQVVHETRSHTDLDSVDLDDISRNIDSPAQDRRLAVDPHTALGDQILTRPP